MEKWSRYALCKAAHLAIAGILAGASLNSQTSQAAAGQPIVSGGTVKTATGQLLRGCHAHIGRQMTTEIRSFFTSMSNVTKLRDQAHLNVIRIAVMTPGWGGFTDINEGAPYVDQIVANCEAAGIYAIINYHGPWIYDDVSSMDIRKFWDFYAARYKDKPFVIYELMNETYQGAPPTGTANDWPTAQNVDIYKNHVRKFAPNNVVMGLLEPVNITANYGPFMRDVVGPACGINWSAGKDAFSFHVYGGTADNILATRNAGIPVVCSEFSFAGEGWTQLQLGGYAMPSEWCERNGVSWMVWQQWQSREPDQLKSVMNYLIPDATSKKYAWWTSSATVPETHGFASVQPTDFVSHAATMIRPNGQVIRTGISGFGIDVLPRSIMSRNSNAHAIR
jgi:hypothetical protein